MLEVGCGHGLVAATLALQSNEREVVGFDVDADKVHSAETIAAAVRAQGGRLSVTVGDGVQLPDGRWDAIVIADVIYLLAPQQQEQLIRACAAAVAPGGVVVLKELDQQPKAKFAFARFEEILATRVFRITAGSELHWRRAQEWAGLMGDCDLDASIRRVDRRYPYPHVLIVGRASTVGP